MNLTLTVQISDDDHALLIGQDLAKIAQKSLELEADCVRVEQKWQAAESAGQLYEARYIRYFIEYRDKYLTKEEAASALEYGEDEGNLSSIGIFDGAGKDLGWTYLHGWN